MSMSATETTAGLLPETHARSAFRSWALHDSPYIAMLLLAMAGVVLRMPMEYWVILTPVFGIICIVAGWPHFTTRQDHLQLVYSQTLSWAALILAIFLLFNDAIKGVLSANAISLAMMTLLALGTFVAGVQARLWRICAVGALLFLAVPGMAWLDKSIILLGVATLAAIAIGGLTWWVGQKVQRNQGQES